MEDLVVSQRNPNHLFVAGQVWDGKFNVMALHKSLDSGKNWTTYHLSSEISIGYAVACDPSDDRIIFVGGLINGKTVLYKTLDGGKGWNEVTGIISGRIYRIVFEPSPPNKIYVGTTEGFFRSENSGISWTKSLSAPFKCIELSTSTPNIIYAGGDEGVFCSRDFGSTWSKISRELLIKDVNCLERDETNKILYAGTEGGSIYKKQL
jgi:photosystem II stability/assembly factor-like uncharacterized protein